MSERVKVSLRESKNVTESLRESKSVKRAKSILSQDIYEMGYW